MPVAMAVGRCERAAGRVAGTNGDEAGALRGCVVEAVVGEMSFLDSQPPSASVRAVKKSWVLAISRKSLTDKLASDMAFAARFYRALGVFLSDRLRSTLGLLGYGSGQRLAEREYADEIDPDTLDNESLPLPHELVQTHPVTPSESVSDRW